MSRLLFLIGLDIIVVGVCSAIVGFFAPRIPDRRLEGRRWPVPLMSWETVAFYRHLGVPWLTRVLPEAGGLFGGQSKSALPGSTREALVAYGREVRRAEWVHWLSSASALLTFLFNPWQLALIFTAVVWAVNGLFIAVLRNNRLRIDKILDRSGA